MLLCICFDNKTLNLVVVRSIFDQCLIIYTNWFILNTDIFLNVLLLCNDLQNNDVYEVPVCKHTDRNYESTLYYVGCSYRVTTISDSLIPHGFLIR